MYAALFTTELDDEPISLHSDHLCGGCSSATMAVILLGHTKGCQTTFCPFAGCEQIGTGTLKVIVEPIKGVVVLATPGPTQPPRALTHGHTIAQVTFLRFIAFSLTCQSI